ncbi:response regulator transcription factor [Weissella kandleri]|uniref:response regulator transcription factor n=1 Tax=Weissella kandleri TaxID=1616 RepID=UPI00387EE6F0
MAKILVVDDEPSILTLLKYNLEQNQFEVMTAIDGETALAQLRQQIFDIIILDIMLPKVSGIVVTQQLRAQGDLTPILMLTALDSENDTVQGLEAGADDYLPKPFKTRELIARVRSLLRRTRDSAISKQHVEMATTQWLTVGHLKIDVKQQMVYKQNQLLRLTPKELALLIYMVEHANRVLSRAEIARGAWGIQVDGLDTRMIDMHIANLRDKLEDQPKSPQILKTVRGVGYRFEIKNEK